MNWIRGRNKNRSAQRTVVERTSLRSYSVSCLNFTKGRLHCWSGCNWNTRVLFKSLAEWSRWYIITFLLKLASRQYLNASYSLLTTAIGDWYNNNLSESMNNCYTDIILVIMWMYFHRDILVWEQWHFSSRAHSQREAWRLLVFSFGPRNIFLMLNRSTWCLDNWHNTNQNKTHIFAELGHQIPEVQSR